MLYPFQNNGLGGAQWGAANCHAPHGMHGMQGMHRMSPANGMWATMMMQMMDMLMTMMGGEMPTCPGVPGNILMPGRSPGFGQAPQSFGGMGTPEFLGNYAPSAAGHDTGTHGRARPTSRREVGSVAPVSSEPVAPGTEALFRRVDNLEGKHGVRDRDELKKITGRLDPATQPWCAAFAMNLLEKHNVLDLDGLKNRNYCPTIEKWARDKGIYGTPDKYSPKPGDAILFDWDGKRGSTDHIGIVEKVENGYVHTIEGNAHNKVQRRKYKLDSAKIDGYVMSKGAGG